LIDWCLTKYNAIYICRICITDPYAGFFNAGFDKLMMLPSLAGRGEGGC
jgi:hypothetical protein